MNVNSKDVHCELCNSVCVSTKPIIKDGKTWNVCHPCYLTYKEAK